MARESPNSVEVSVDSLEALDASIHVAYDRRAE
jgi:hypothetical protein